MAKDAVGYRSVPADQGVAIVLVAMQAYMLRKSGCRVGKRVRLQDVKQVAGGWWEPTDC